MPLDSISKRKKQANITRVSFLIVLGFFVVVYLALRVTGTDKVIKDKIIEMAMAATEKAAPPPPPPPPNADLKAPPKIDMNFKVDMMTSTPKIDAAFDASMLTSVTTDMDAPNISMEAMSIGSNEITNLVTNSQLPVLNLATNIGFSVGGAGGGDEAKSTAVGTGKRTSGKVPLAILDIPGDSIADKWTGGEMEAVADYVSRNTSMKCGLGARNITFVGIWTSYKSWLTDAKKRAGSEIREMSLTEPEIDGLTMLANLMPYVAERNYEQARVRLRKVMTDYIRIRYNVKMKPDTPERGTWDSTIAATSPLYDWQKEYIRDAEKSYREFMNLKVITGEEAKGIFMLLRITEMMQLPILFCEPRGVPQTILPENLRLLRTYLFSEPKAGFIYFINTSTKDRANGLRGLISQILQEGLTDPVGDKQLAELKKGDQEVSGYNFRDPDPNPFHPWTFIGMMIPRKTSIAFTVFNKFGNVVYADTLKDKPAGTYLQKKRDFKWYGNDNQGNPLESGYYIYRIESDLFQKTGPLRISQLRRLPNGKHSIFSSFFPVSEVPSTITVKTEELPYAERGVFGVSYKGRLCICYTEGYQEKSNLTSSDKSAKENGEKWITNVIFEAVGPGSLAR